MEIRGKKVFLVTIEWDGLQPPATWYRRLHRLGLVVQGNKEEGPIQRRATQISHQEDQIAGVIYQEGSIMISSLTLARTLAHLALEHGATNVDLGELLIQERITKTRADRELLNRIQRTLGRRGRPPAAQNWVIACHECLEVSTIEDTDAIRCLHCGGLDIHARTGFPIPFQWDGLNHWDAWTRTRFQGSHWEPAPIDPGGRCPAFDQDLVDRVEADPAWEALASSPELLTQINRMDEETARQFLDALFVSLKHRTPEQRNQDRLAAVVEYYRLGNTKPIPVSEPDQPDLLVAAGLLDPTFVALSYQEAAAV